MIFGSRIAFSLICILSCGSVIIFLQTAICPADQALYQKLVKETAALRSTKSLERHPSTQIRENAQKDIWTVSGTERVHFQMHSDHSNLSLLQKKGNIEATETLEGISCMNGTLLLKAIEGAYTYPNHHFVASEVECTHELGELKAQKALLQSMPANANKQLLSLTNGVCFTASQEKQPFSISSQTALCEALSKKSFSFIQQQKIEFFHCVEMQMMEDLRAFGGSAIYKTGSLALYPEMPKLYCHLERNNSRISAHEIHFDLIKETIFCLHAKGMIPTKEEEPFQFSANTLLWEKENGTIALSQNVHIEQAEKFSIHAESAHIGLHERQMNLVEINNNVRLFSPRIQNKDSFALADRIVFHPEQQKLILTAIPPKRVLFWQEGVSLSAPEIHIQKDPVTNDEFIQGKGDIHFTFSTEEQNIIDQFISKYL
jgi:hypothetical protein